MFFSIELIKISQSENALKTVQTAVSQFNVFRESLSSVQGIVKATIFAQCKNEEAFQYQKSYFDENIARDFPILLVSQEPIGYAIVFEIWIINDFDKNITFNHVKEQGSEGLLLKHSEFELLFSSHYSTDQKVFSETVKEVFESCKNILKSFTFDFGNVVRQWNYVEDITMEKILDQKRIQNYQIFNDIRSQYYAESNFENGYPAATGIGFDFGGCAIEIIALKGCDAGCIVPIANNLQADAHNYSKKVLIGDSLENQKSATTPKFERGKKIEIADCHLLFVSGTASILGEKTLFPNIPNQQTIETQKIIQNLISERNLAQNHISKHIGLQIINSRIYIRNREDFETISKVYKKTSPLENCIFLRAAICRNDLVVEIEENLQFN